MKKSILAIVFLTSCFIANAQWGSKKINGDGNQVTTTRDLQEYDEIKISGFFDVFLVVGEEGQIKVEAEKNLHEYIITEIKGNTLIIKSENGVNLNPSRNENVVITIPFKSLDAVSLSGSGDVVGRDLIKAQDFKCDVTGSGNMTLEVETITTSGKVVGSGDLTLAGMSKQVNFEVTGSGDIVASNLKATDADVTVSGSGDIELHCDGGKLTARVNGSGDIEFSGNPSREDSKVNGSGSISKH